MNRQKKWLLKILCLLVFAIQLGFSGCASNTTQYGAVKITSTPAGAEVVNLKDDSSLGITPAKVSFSGDGGTAEFVTIQLRKTGYLDRITSFWINRRHDNEAVAQENAIDIHIELDKEKTE